MKNTFRSAALLCVLCVALLLTGCNRLTSDIRTVSDLAGKPVAVPIGTIADELLLKAVPEAQCEYYQSALDGAMALRAGQVAAVVYDVPVLQNCAAKLGDSSLRVLDELVTHDDYGIAVALGNDALKATIDEVVAELRDDGRYDKMIANWITGTGGKIPTDLSPENGVLIVGTAAVAEPFSFYHENAIVGFDIELMAYVAQKLGMGLQLVDMEFGALIPALLSGEVDAITANLTITPERAELALFSEPYYSAGMGVLVKN